jgi:hypothetical protein
MERLLSESVRRQLSISFATGEGFSRSCRKFTQDMQASRFPNLETMKATRSGAYEYHSVLEFTLNPVPHRNVTPQFIGAEEFAEGLP